MYDMINTLTPSHRLGNRQHAIPIALVIPESDWGSLPGVLQLSTKKLGTDERKPQSPWSDRKNGLEKLEEENGNHPTDCCFAGILIDIIGPKNPRTKVVYSNLIVSLDPLPFL